MTDAELLSSAIKQSGLSVGRFAVDILVRDPRTVFRWLAGGNSIPQAVRAKLLELTARQFYEKIPTLDAVAETQHIEYTSPRIPAIAFEKIGTGGPVEREWFDEGGNFHRLYANGAESVITAELIADDGEETNE